MAPNVTFERFIEAVSLHCGFAGKFERKVGRLDLFDRLREGGCIVLLLVK